MTTCSLKGSPSSLKKTNRKTEDAPALQVNTIHTKSTQIFMLCVLSLCPFIRRTPVFPPLSKVPAEFPGTSSFPAERRIIQFSPSRCVSPQTMRFPHKTARRTLPRPFHIFVKLNRQHKTPPNFHALSSIVVKSFAQRNLTSSSAPPSTLQSAAVAPSPLLRCPVPSVCNTSFRQANPASTASRSAFPPYRAHIRTPRRNAAPS